GVHFNPAGTVATNVTSFIDTALTPGQQYFYQVVAVSVFGASAPSNTATATTSAPPAAPSNAMAALISSTEIDLTWQDNANNEDGYQIFRKDGSGGTFKRLAGLPPNSTSYQDRGRPFLPGTLYDYHIQAFNSAGYSPAAEASVTTVPAAPSAVGASSAFAQAITLSWAAPTGAVSFNIYRSTTSGGEGSTPVANGVTGTAFVDGGLADGATYYYQVSAVDAGGEGARSGEVSAIVTFPRLTGQAFEDKQGDGLKNGVDAGLPGVTLELLD